MNNCLSSLILLHLLSSSLKGLGIHRWFALCDRHNASCYFFLLSWGGRGHFHYRVVLTITSLLKDKLLLDVTLAIIVCVPLYVQVNDMLRTTMSVAFIRQGLLF